MLILGIDPGKHGAFALFDTAAHSVACTDMPDTTAALHDFVASLPIIRLCVIEKPFYPAHIGTTNAAKIAEAFGVLRGALAWRSIPTRDVPPKEWKAALGLSSSKSASREKAGQMFPDAAQQFALVKHDGRAEAALIAAYGARFAP